jgi:CheY-like chemotaxis protein
MLEKQHRCEFASNGKEAVEKYSGNDFDIIFMDIQMPIMDGIEATIAIREQEVAKNKRRTPIIASTAIDSNTLNNKCIMAAGMDGYMMKPYSEKQVHEIINLHTDSSEEVCSEGESDMDDRPLTPTPPRKVLRNDFPARSSAPWSAPSEGRERRRLLARFHFLSHERDDFAQGVLPKPSALRKSFF